MKKEIFTAGDAIDEIVAVIKRFQRDQERVAPTANASVVGRYSSANPKTRVILRTAGKLTGVFPLDEGEQ